MSILTRLLRLFVPTRITIQTLDSRPCVYLASTVVRAFDTPTAARTFARHLRQITGAAISDCLGTQ